MPEARGAGGGGALGPREQEQQEQEQEQEQQGRYLHPRPVRGGVSLVSYAIGIGKKVLIPWRQQWQPQPVQPLLSLERANLPDTLAHRPRGLCPCSGQWSQNLAVVLVVAVVLIVSPPAVG